MVLRVCAKADWLAVKLTPKEEKITRLALDHAAKEGERASAALKLFESLPARGVTVEDRPANAAPEIVYVEPIHMIKAVSIFLAIWSLLLCSCAGFRLPPEEPTDNRPRIPGSGDIR
jgi:hypothetical protein